MQYFILRKIKIWGKDQYSIEAKAQNGYDSITEVTEKKIALETLNDSKDVSYVIVNNGTPIEFMSDNEEDKVVNI
jgi:hypothetical protein